MLQYVDADKCLLTASWDRSVCIHDDMDNDEGVVLRTMKGHGKDVTCAAASFALKLMASSGADGHILVWNYAMGNLEGMCKGHAQDVTALEFLEPYPVLVSADILGNVVLWGMPPGPPSTGSSRWCASRTFCSCTSTRLCLRCPGFPATPPPAGMHATPQ